MPEVDATPSWGDLMEEQDKEVFPRTEENIDGDTKTIVEYRLNEDGKKVKISRVYKVEHKKVAKSVAKRKLWKKFGAAKKDNPHGPDPATTYMGEDVFLTLTTNREEFSQQDDDPLKKLQGAKIVTCRICKGDHWTTKCPYKDSLPQQVKDEKEATKTDSAPAAASSQIAGASGGQSGKYVPPSLRGEGGGQRRGEAMQRRDESATVRVTNLSEDTREPDLQELFRPFGPIARIFLAKDKTTNQSKGFAFISYIKREDAARAIVNLQGYGYDHLILNVEWAKPSGN